MKENCLFFILIILIIFGCIFVKKEDQIREAFGGFKEGFREGQGRVACGVRLRVGGRRCSCDSCNVNAIVRNLGAQYRNDPNICRSRANFQQCFQAGGQWRTDAAPPPPPPRPPPPPARRPPPPPPARRPPPPPPPRKPAVTRPTGATCVENDVVRVNGVWRNCCVRCGPGYGATSTIGDGGRCLTCGIVPPPPPPRKCTSYGCPCGYLNNGEQQCADNNCTQTQCCSKIPKETIPHCISQLSWGRNCAKCDPEGWELSTVPKNAPRPPPPPPPPQPTCGSQTVPSPPPADCFKQVAPECKKIPQVPIDNCIRQRDWGKSCNNCAVGYKMSSDKTRCDLIPIPFCKTQEREVCLECQEAYRPNKSARKCDRIPKVKIPHCTNQRDWGAYCYECGSDQSGYMVSEDKSKCIPRPISNCKDQEGLRCNKCRFGYSKSLDWTSCDIVAIKDCAIQNKSICAECKMGYKMGEDRRKCDLLPISNCQARYEAFRPGQGFGKGRAFSKAS